MNAEPERPGIDLLRAFCGDAARQVVGLETRLRTLVVEADRHPDLLVLQDALGASLRIARALLDAGRRGQHETVLALRPLLRALATSQCPAPRSAAPPGRRRASGRGTTVW